MWTICNFKRATAVDTKQDFSLVWRIMYLSQTLLLEDTGLNAVFVFKKSHVCKENDVLF